MHFLLINPPHIWSSAIIPLQSSEALRLVSGLGILADPVTLRLKLHGACSSKCSSLSPHSHIVKQFSKPDVFEGALHRFSGKATEKESLTRKHNVNWKHSAIPQPYQGKVHSWRRYHQCAAVEWGRCMMLKASGHPHYHRLSVHPSFFNPTLRIAFCIIFREISSRSNTPTSTQSILPFTHIHSHADIHIGLDNTPTLCRRTRLFSECLRLCEPLVNNCVCSPLQMPAQDQETMVRLLTTSSSSSNSSNSSSSVLTPNAPLFRFSALILFLH